MTRPFLASLVVTLFSLPAAAQVKIHIPTQHQKKYETIHASVENAGSKPVTFCIEFGQTSPKGSGEIETTPSPFWVQKDGNGKWSTLIIRNAGAKGKVIGRPPKTHLDQDARRSIWETRKSGGVSLRQLSSEPQAIPLDVNAGFHCCRGLEL